MDGQPSDGVLAGVRILDLADESAVFGAKLLADLGADVLRVEPPGGDALRRLGPFAAGVAAPEGSLSHWWFNTGKRSAVLDPASAADRQTLHDLAVSADIVIETGGHPVDPAALRSANPALTVVSVSPFGRTGPRRDWLGPDLVTWAMGGGMVLTGLPGRPPLRANWALAHQVAGLYAAIGAVAGLYRARATGRGVHFDLSRQEALASMHETLVILHLYAGQAQTRQGSENPVAAPYGVFPAADGRDVMMAVVTQGQWAAFLAWLAETGEVEPWLLDPAIVPTAARALRRAEIHATVARWTRRFPAEFIVTGANQRRIPAATVNTPISLFDDPQLQFRGFFVDVDQPVLGRPVRYPSFACHFSLGSAAIRPAPRLGADEPRFTAPPAANPPPGVPDDSPPLTGLKVLDLTWVLAGPTGSRVLGDLGADLIKIEPRDVGDIVRGISPFWGGQADPNTSGFFHRLTRNKRSLTLDLKKPEAIAIVRRLARRADIVIDNFGAGVMRRLGLDPEELLAAKPDLIQISLSGFGQEGPSRHDPSFAQVSQARAGVTAATGYADGTVSGVGISIGDTGAGLQLAAVALAAIEQRRRTGRGVRIDMSQLEATSLLIGPALLDAAVNGRAFAPIGNQLPDRAAAPHGAYPAAGEDRWIAIAVLTEDQWTALAGLMGRPDLPADPRFATAADRVAHHAELDGLIAAWTADRDPHDLAERLQTAGVPAGVVQDGADLTERDPHLAERGFFQTVDQPDLGPIRMDSLPLRWGDGPVPIRIPSPRIGEWNEWILREVLGLGEEEIVDLIINEVL